MTSKKIHLRLDFDKKFFPDEKICLETFLNTEEYVVFLANIQFPEEGTQKLTLLLPRSLVEVMLSMELQLEGISPKTILLYSWNKDFCADMQKKLNTRYTKVLVANEPDDVLHLCKNPNVCAVAMELERISIPLNHNDSIFVKRIQSNEFLQKLPFILTVSQGSKNTYAFLQHSGLKAAMPLDLTASFEPWVQKILIT